MTDLRNLQALLDQRTRELADTRAREEVHRLVLESIDEIVYSVALDGATTAGRLTLMGGRIEQILGYKPEEFVEAPGKWRTLIHPEDVQVFEQQTRGYLDRQESGARLFRILSAKTGSYRWMEDRMTPQVDAKGRVTGYVAVARDVTERRVADEALTASELQLRQAQKMEAVGRLAGGMAHDFNNLLTAITGYTEILLDQAAPGDPVRQGLDEIKKAADRAAALTRQLLAFSRRQVLQPRVVDLNAIVADMEQMLRRLIGEHIYLVTMPDRTLGRAKADPGQIEQVIMNLVVNARDAMPDGGTLIVETTNVDVDETYISRQPLAQPGAYVMLAVSDTGSGMDQEVLSHLFEPFYTTKEPGKGTGLGLSTVYGIVKQSGGYVWAYSEVGKGSTFKVYLPRVDEAASVARPQKSLEGLPQGRETILLVEDEDVVRRLVREILEMTGYTVLEAAHGGEALSVSNSYAGPIHLMLTDVVMAQMSGRELADRLVVQRPATKVLYMSGYTDDAIVHHGVLEPGVAFLQKPFTPGALARKIREVLDGGVH